MNWPWFLAGASAAWLLLRRRSRPAPYYPPAPMWGAPQRGSGASAKGTMLVILAVSGLLLGLVMARAGVGATPPKGGSGPSLASIFGALPKPGSFELVKPKGKVAKVPKGLSFTNGAGCRPKGDWRKVDSRVRKVLVNAAKRYSLRVSCLRSGHSKYVKNSRRVSNHSVGRGVDIDRVNGQPVRAWNRAARRLALDFGKGRLGARPSEVGSPWFTAGVFFTDRGHKNHLHVGFGRR